MNVSDAMLDDRFLRDMLAGRVPMTANEARALDLPVAHAVPKPRRPARPSTRVKVVCLECTKRFSTASVIPTCPKCGGSDVELA